MLAKETEFKGTKKDKLKAIKKRGKGLKFED